MRGRQRRVATEGDLDRRSEPAQIKSAVRAGNDECRIGQIHFRGDILHPFGGTRFVEQTYRRRIAFENSRCERVNLKKRDFQSKDSFLLANLPAEGEDTANEIIAG